ncbi:hypothetical protein ACFPZ0_16180 [Streptomonospora nanhaiensis]|uniref:Uncharacterized protein n=1 Tax=Streptomonospora nanhaiensis TaxID=1323731 RepID=A0A853BMW1_9ACTN|nr:hypothetical protein [Streptomonospora nanhaiensis]MBV2363413.1 hypothetical protein [Streptomonospora nanhaiensis]MBX9389652.1 hypothetical protein [Streptomonospora nanhaiensis]NYI96929.1 hypothetical protein [Streptomonospora nanhaiensis]
MRREEALEALVAAQDITERVRRRGRWYAGYSAGFGVITVALVLAVGLWPSPMGAVVATPLAVAGFAALTVYCLRRPMSPRRHAAVHLTSMGFWSAAYVAVLVVGATAFPGSAAWWVPGALVCALPPFAAALYTLARTAEPRA